MTTRKFCNSDLPDIARLWTQHYQVVETPPSVSVATLEQAIPARIFFRSEHLRVAVEEEQIVGFAHWLPDPIDQHVACIVSLCIDSSKNHQKISHELLVDCQREMTGRGISVLYGGADWTHLTGYAGLPPLGPGEGIIDEDRLGAGWFMQAGFSPHRRLTRYRVALDHYRPPVDRSLVNLRRKTTMECDLVPPTFWRRAAALAHLDVHRFIATNRENEAIAWAEFLLSDPETHVLPGDCAILDQWQGNEPAGPQNGVRFVIAAGMVELSQRQVRYIDSVADDRHPDRAILLRSLRFEKHSEGTVFVKRL